MSLRIFGLVCLLSVSSFAAMSTDVVLKEAGLDKIASEFDAQEIFKQAEQYKGKVDFWEAMRAALKSFLEDDSDSESPRAIAADAGDLMEFLNQPSSYITLVQASDFTDPQKRRAYPPELGERLSEYWVFYLEIPSLSDHMFWAVISRNRLPYNYGFN